MAFEWRLWKWYLICVFGIFGLKHERIEWLLYFIRTLVGLVFGNGSLAGNDAIYQSVDLYRINAVFDIGTRIWIYKNTFMHYINR